MARFLVVGAVAWDRPIWLASALGAGARIIGRTLNAQLDGRLGGGGANAGIALLAAGHEVAVHAAVAHGDEGEALLQAAQSAGLDMRLARRTDRAWKNTLILIEPSGERVILGLDPAAATAEPDAAPLSAAEAKAYAPQGLYLRAGRLPGAATVMAACLGPTITHWPTDDETLACATILVGSRDDLRLNPEESAFAAARSAGAQALRWAILTDGANPVCADNGETVLTCWPPAATVADATGAGDVFAAGLLEALAAGALMQNALEHACRWGAAAVGLDASAPVGADPALFAPYR